jgi:hypothetical protein
MKISVATICFIFLIVDFTATLGLAQVPTPGLVGYYPFNGNANDESGSGYNALSVTAVLASDRFGNASSAYHFDGGAQVLLPNAFQYQSMTISAWFNSWQDGCDRTIFTEYANSANWFKLFENYRDAHVGSYLWINGTYNNAWILNDGVNNAPLNRWNFVCVVVDQASNVAKEFVNGQLLQTVSTKNYSLPDLGTVTVTAIGRSYDTSTDHFVGEIDDVRLYDRALSEQEIGALYHEGGWQCGTVEGTVTSHSNGLSGVAVRLLDENGLPVIGFETTATDVAGHYSFNAVPPGDLQIMLVEPLGYAADQNPKAVTVSANATSVVDFTLAWTVLSDKAEKWSYWKNQFDKVVKGQKTQETPQNLTSYIATIQEHYTPHFNFYAFTSFAEWQQVLSKPTHPTKRDEALAEVAALVLNVGSLKLGQYTAITEDGRTAGDVLTYVSSLIANPMSTDKELELAKKLAEKANHGDNQKIKAGEVPVGAVLYKGGEKSIDWGFVVPNCYALYSNYPNPFNPITTIQFDLPKSGFVSLKVYDYLGKEVSTLVDGECDAGRHSIRFDAGSLASGVYLYTLQSYNFVQTRKLTLVK